MEGNRISIRENDNDQVSKQRSRFILLKTFRDARRSQRLLQQTILSYFMSRRKHLNKTSTASSVSSVSDSSLSASLSDNLVDFELPSNEQFSLHLRLSHRSFSSTPSCQKPRKH